MGQSAVVIGGRAGCSYVGELGACAAHSCGGEVGLGIATEEAGLGTLIWGVQLHSCRGGVGMGTATEEVGLGTLI